MSMRGCCDPYAALTPNIGMDDAHWPFILGAPVQYTLFLFEKHGFTNVIVQGVDGNDLMVFGFIHF